MKRYAYYGALFFLVFAQNRKAVSQDRTDSTIGPARGSLVIVGGGTVGPEIWDRFIQLAGGAAEARIVVVPTAGSDSDIVNGKIPPRDILLRLGVRHVIVLHTRDPKVANTDSFAAPLKNATGVWFVGGRQWKLADAYLNTLTYRAFQGVLQRGGVIGGSSAGATIQGSFLLRGDTKGNTILEGDHLKGFNFIHDVAIDQHILRRNREFDLIGVIKRHPRLLGIGIDEGTAIVVHGNRFQVIGRSYVAIYDARRIRDLADQRPAPNASSTGPFYFLQHGQWFNLQSRQVSPDRPVLYGAQ